MVTCVAYHPSGTLIATSSTDGSIKIFDIRTHKLIQHYGDAHGQKDSVASSVNSIKFGEDGSWLISTGNDGLIKVFCG